MWQCPSWKPQPQTIAECEVLWLVTRPRTTHNTFLEVKFNSGHNHYSGQVSGRHLASPFMKMGVVSSLIQY